MFNKSKTRRNLRIEGLEDRKMMAGDVSVGMFGGALDIDGDEAGNALQIRPLNGGDYEVRGLYRDGGWTLLNGSYDPVVVSNVDHMDILLKGGDDLLYVEGEYGAMSHQLSGNLTIKGGGGSDTVNIQDMYVVGDVDIDMDSAYNPYLFYNDQSQGDDTLKITDIIVGDDINIDTLGGNDTVEFDATYQPSGYPRWNVAEDVFIRTGDGDDDVITERVFTHETFYVHTGNDHDTIDARSTYAYSRNMYLYTGAGNDTVFLDGGHTSNVYISNLYVNTGSGSDVVELRNVSTAGTVDVRTGSGSDSVIMDEVHAHDVLYANLGSGDDALSISNSSATVASLRGGSHGRSGDWLGLYNNDFAAQVAYEFEY